MHSSSGDLEQALSDFAVRVLGEDSHFDRRQPLARLPILSRTIGAHEVGEFAYCSRAWWLVHVRGESPITRVRRRERASRPTQPRPAAGDQPVGVEDWACPSSLWACFGP